MMSLFGGSILCLFIMIAQSCVSGQATAPSQALNTTAATSAPIPVQLVFQGLPYPNNSVLSLNDVGDYSTGSAILCTTNRSPCCFTPPNRFGQWHYPDGSMVPINAAGEDFYRDRGNNQAIHLNRRNNAQSPTGSFCCELPDNSDVHHTLCLTLVVVSITPSGSNTAGEHYKLTCSITSLTNIPIFTWFLPSTGDGDTRMVSYEMPSATTHTSILQFDPLKSSHEGKYTCQVTVGALRVMSSTQVNVMVPPPSAVTLTASPDGTVVTGSSLTLTCTIELSEAVDIPVTVSTVWNGPSGTQFTTTTSVATRMTVTFYTSTVTIGSVEASDSGEYTCTATVNSFHTDSEGASGMINVAVVLPAPTNVTSISQSTSITTTWTQPEGDVANSYEITYSYQGPCPGVLQSETVSISGSRRQFTAVDLHEFSNYTITIIATNGAGSSPPVMITTATSPNAPSGPPQSLTVTSTTLFSITIQWGEVECLEQNREITGYSVRYYGFRGATANVTGASNRMFTAPGLIPRTTYTFEVAAVSDSGTGPYGMVNKEAAILNSVGLLLNGVLYGNNSVVTLDEIGEDGAALFCLTNKTDCCRMKDTPQGVGGIGEWVFPDGSSVDNDASGDAIYRGRGPSTVRLQRRNNAQTTGLFHCEIPDASGTNQQYYVGVYPVNSGSPSITGLLYNRSTLTLTCNSTGGPATTVTWRKNGAVVEVDGTTYHQSQRVVNTRTATYENTLSSSTVANLVGTFTCTVTNSRGSSNDRSVTLNGVVILGADQSLVVGEAASITCVSDAPATRIEWLDRYRRVVARVTSMDQLDLTFNPVNDSIHNSVYTCRVTRGDRMVEDNVTITVIVPPNSVTVIITTSGSATAGQEYTLQCEVSSIPGLTNTPTATWFHQNGSHITSSGGITISPRTPSPSSSLAFTTLTTFHGGGYTCEGRVESPALDSPETVSKTQHVTVQIPSPTTVIVTASPDGNINTRAPPLILTCTIELSKAVDIPVTVNTVWNGPSGTQFTSVATRETDTTYTSTASFSSSVSSDSGEYTCRVTLSSTAPGPFVRTSDEAVGTKRVKDVLQRFQLKLRRTDDCIAWNANKAKEIRSYIFDELLQAITSRCQCELPKENLLNGVFSCLDSHDQTTYRSTIIGTQSFTATQLEGYLQDWVTSDPTLTIQWYTVKLDPQCPVSISSLGEPECGLSQ